MEKEQYFYLSLHYDNLKDTEKSLEYYIMGFESMMCAQEAITKQVCLNLEILLVKRIQRLQETLENLGKMRENALSPTEVRFLEDHEEGIQSDTLLTFNRAISLFQIIKDNVSISNHKLLAYVMKTKADFLRRKAIFYEDSGDTNTKAEATALYEYSLVLLTSTPVQCPYKLDVMLNYAKHALECYGDESKIKSLREIFYAARRFFMCEQGEDTRYYLYMLKYIGLYLDSKQNIRNLTFDRWILEEDDLNAANIIVRGDLYTLYVNM